MGILILIGFLLPWQTRILLRTPSAQGVSWDFGVLSFFVSQAFLLAWLVYEAWKSRKEIALFFAHVKQSARYKIVAACLGLFVGLQLIFSADRLLTLQWMIGVALLAGLACVLHREKESRIPFVSAFLIGIVLQGLLAAMQVFIGATFESSLLGMAVHKAAESGTAVIDYAGQRYIRAYGGQSHPNIFGGLTLLGLLLFNWMLRFKKTLGVRKNIIQYTLLVTSALFFSFSRTAWIGLVIWLALLIRDRQTLRESQITLLRWTAITFAVLCVIFFPLVVTRATASTSLEQRSITERTADVGQWGKVMRSHGLFGTGVGAYTATLEDVAGDRRVPVHSVPLLVFAEFGLVGIFLAIIAAVALKVRVRSWAPVIILAPIALLDHYLFSLWSGQVILFAFLFQMFEVGNNDEADNNEQRPRTDLAK